LRGCAESFGAIDTKFMEQQEDNGCVRLHDILDIKECICKSRKYCYAGRGRRRAASQSGLWAVIVALKQFQITHAIDISNIGLNKKFPGIEYKEFNVDDNNIANISKYFEEACEFIDAARNKGGKTVIYCAAGISRSATLAIMYLVIKGGKSLRDSYYHVNQVRFLFRSCHFDLPISNVYNRLLRQEMNI
uniref:protein-tyrosine-phosphatase n=1 Tax=Angiostrongylus cantonensis TaxID=6313 RepID=A0A0K0D4S4_ANGCA